MTLKRASLRYTGARNCRLGCKDCYLAEGYMAGLPLLTPGFELHEPVEIHATQYMNVTGGHQESRARFVQELKNFSDLLGRKPKTYMLVSDISTFWNIEQSLSVLPEIEKRFGIHKPVLSLSFKSRSDLNITPEIVKWAQQRTDKNSPPIILSYNAGLDPIWVWEHILEMTKIRNVYGSLMLKKPWKVSLDLIKAFMFIGRELGKKIQLDECVFKLARKTDCTISQAGEDLPVYSYVEGEGWFSCTYPTSRCQVSFIDDDEEWRSKLYDEIVGSMRRVYEIT